MAEQAGPAGAQLIAQANDAFITAMHYAAVGTTIFSLLGALVALLWLPGKRTAAPAPARALAEEPDAELVEA